MIKFGLILLTCLVLLATLIANGAQRVQFDPTFFPVFQTPLGLVMLTFFTLGVLLAVLLALIDRAELTGQNRKLNKKVKQLESELGSLRQMMTVDQDLE